MPELNAEGASPSRWVGPVTGIALIASMVWFVRLLWTEAWPAGGWIWGYRLIAMLGVIHGSWVGIQLLRRRPKAYHTGMVISGLVAIVLLATTLWSLVDTRFTTQITITLAVAVVVLAGICGLLARDWRRMRLTGSDQ